MEMLLIVLFGLTMLYVSSSNRIETYIKMIMLQGFLLFLMSLKETLHFGFISMAFVGFETLIVKTFLVPGILDGMMKKNLTLREADPRISNFSSLILSTAILGFGFMLAYVSDNVSGAVRPLYFGVSVSSILIALFLILKTKKLVTHVAAYIMMENSMFLLSFSVAGKMPVVVSLGILLDVFIALFLFGIFITKIKSTFNEIDIDNLTDLKE